MAGKRQKKKVHRLRKRRLHLKKEMEKVKLWSGGLAEVGAVQTELMEAMDTNSNLEDLHLICYQLRGVNTQWALLDAMIRNSIDGMLAVLAADKSKGNS